MWDSSPSPADSDAAYQRGIWRGVLRGDFEPEDTPEEPAARTELQTAQANLRRALEGAVARARRRGVSPGQLTFPTPEWRVDWISAEDDADRIDSHRDLVARLDVDDPDRDPDAVRSDTADPALCYRRLFTFLHAAVWGDGSFGGIAESSVARMVAAGRPPTPPPTRASGDMERRGPPIRRWRPP